MAAHSGFSGVPYVSAGTTATASSDFQLFGGSGKNGGLYNEVHRNGGPVVKAALEEMTELLEIEREVVNKTYPRKRAVHLLSHLSEYEKILLMHLKNPSRYLIEAPPEIQETLEVLDFDLAKPADG